MTSASWSSRLRSWVERRRRFTGQLTVRDGVPPRPEYRVPLPGRPLPPALAAAPLRSLSYVAFDTETTGLEPKRDEIVSIAGVRVIGGRIAFDDSFVQLVHPGRPIPSTATRIHGITNEMVAGKPPLRTVLPPFKDFVGHSVLAGHNVSFDLAFLAAREHDTGVRFDNPVLCVMTLSAFLFPDAADHSLDAIVQRLDVPVEGRHTALGDALATAEALVRMLQHAEARGIATLGALVTQSAMTSSLRARSALLAR